MAKGIIYCMTTIVPGLVKIGKTGSENFEQRMYNLERNGYVNVVGLKRRFAIEVEDYDEKETLIHEIFSKSNVPNTELFAVDIELVVQLLSSLEGKQVFPKTISKEEVFNTATDEVQRNMVKANKMLIPDGTYYISDKKIKASMRVENGKFIVIKGSQCLDCNKDWIPEKKGSSLYIRPFIISTEPSLNVKPSSKYTFMIILSPVGAYYKEGLNPVKIWVEDEYVRAVRGGTGFAKTAANYAISLAGQAEAHEQDYEQVLWLDGVERKYVEEVGSMNIFFVIDGEVITPELTGSVLPGITRKSALEVCKSKGYKVSERRISIQEIADAYDNGKLDEVFGTGTAAVISPVGHLKWGDKVMTINNNEIGPISQMLDDTMTGIQWGKIPDEFGWIEKID